MSAPPDDPFQGLEEWARDAERRATREHARRRLISASTAPWRALRRLCRALTRPATLTVAAVLAVLVAAGWIERDDLLDFGSRSGAAQAHPTHAHPSGAYATSTATGAPRGPFEDTPAAAYPEGAAGLTMPPASAVDGATAVQVAAGLDQVRQALVAARLDRRMLVDRDFSAFVPLFAPGNRDYVAQLSGSRGRLALVSQLAPGTRLLPDAPRVKGRTTYRAATTDAGIRYLEIVTNYVWIYPVEGTDRGPGSRLVIVHDEIHWGIFAPGAVRPGDAGLWVRQTAGYLSNMDCTELDRGLLALPNHSFTSAQPGPATREDDPYDPDRSLEVVSGCPGDRGGATPTGTHRPS